MDRRQKKTRDAIFRAFSTLLEKKRYENITVQEIIDAANVGRSTFYAHFETKDSLLRSMCTDIFHHVFTERLPRETEIGCRVGSKNLELKLGHILYHLGEQRSNLAGILSGESGDLFLSYFRSYLRDLFLLYKADFQADVPPDYLLNHLVSSFAETAKWWITTENDYTPEAVAGFFITICSWTNQ